jgi:tetratricopeptide (TPR) repeat protein
MRMAALTFSLVLLAELSISTPNSRAQEVSASTQVAEADKAYQAKDWNRAATLYGQLTTEQANNGRFWYRLGVSLNGTGANERAIAAFQKALENGVPPAYGDY